MLLRERRAPTRTLTHAVDPGGAPEEPSLSVLPQSLKGRVVLAALTLVALLGVGIVWAWSPDPPGSDWVADLGCSEGPFAHYQPDAFQYPYGRVRSCEVLGREAPWFGEVDASSYLLLDTDRGRVAVRVDYRNRELERQMTAVAVELGPADLPGSLSPQDRSALEEAISARGGPATQPWVVRYGDG
jgi:hypothetical protein